MNYPQEQRINQHMDSQVKKVLQRSITFEQMKRHLFFSLDALSVYLDDHRNRDTDTVEQFLEAAEFAKTQGRKYPTEELSKWLENELNRLF